MEPVPVWQDYVWPQPDGTVRLLYGPNQRTEFAEPERGPMDTPASFQSNSSSSEVYSESERAKMEFERAGIDFNFANTLVQIKILSSLSYNELLFYWLSRPTNQDIGYASFIFPKTIDDLLTRLTSAKMLKEAASAGIVNKTLESLEASRRKALDDMERWSSRFLPDWRRGDLEDWQGFMFTKEGVKRTIDRARIEFSFEKLLDVLQTLINLGKSAREKMRFLEKRYTQTEQTNRPDPGINLNDPNIIRQLAMMERGMDPVQQSLQILRYDWYDLEGKIREDEETIDNIEDLIHFLHDPEFRVKNVGFLYYGEAVGENMPPWKGSSLSKLVNEYQESVYNAQQKLSKLEDQLKRVSTVSFDELKLLYKGKTRKSSENSLRTHHKEELLKKQESVQNSLKQSQRNLEEKQRELDDFLRYKAQLEGESQPKKPKPIVIDLLSDEGE